MANFTLRRVDLFPSGTTVEARKRSAFGTVDPARGTAPPGAAEKSAVSDGTTIAFNGLAAETEYVFSGQVGGVWQHTSAMTGSSSTLARSGSNIGHGRKTVAAAGTPEQLGSGKCRSVVLTALAGNVAVGGDNSVRAAPAGSINAVIISAGQTISIDVADLGAIWLDVVTNGDGVAYTFVV